MTYERFLGSVLYVDHFSDFMYNHLITGMTSIATLESKQAYKRAAAAHGVKVKSYYVDNLRFNENNFKGSCISANQQLAYCGVRAHHQNAVVQSKIKEVRYGGGYPPTRKTKMVEGYQHSTMDLYRSSNYRTTQLYCPRQRRPQPFRKVYRQNGRQISNKFSYMGLPSDYSRCRESVRRHWHSQVGTAIVHRDLPRTLAMSNRICLTGSQPADRHGKHAISRGMRWWAHDRPIPFHGQDNS